MLKHVSGPKTAGHVMTSADKAICSTPELERAKTQARSVRQLAAPTTQGLRYVLEEIAS